MKKLKLAIVSAFPPSKDTLNEYAYHLVKHMESNDSFEEITIVCNKLPKGTYFDSDSHGPKVNFREVWEFNKLGNLFSIKRAIDKIKPDIVFYNLQFLSFGDKKVPAALGLLSPLVSKLSGYTSVVLLHNIIETVDLKSAGISNNRIKTFLFKAIGTLLTRFILSADMVAVTMARYVKILEEKYKVKNVTLIPHGSFESTAIPEFKSQGPKRVMTFGKFGTYKKVEKLIEAVQLVRSHIGQEIELVIAGTDNPNVPGYLERVKQKYNHISNIKFTGYVEEEDVPSLFRESTAVVFPYTSTTGSSGVLHQAGSYGKAVALPTIGDLKELIEEEGYKGSYFMPEDKVSMARAIERLLTDEAYRNELGMHNYTAACSLPMEDIMEWYNYHFQRLVQQNSNTVTQRADQLVLSTI